MLLNKKVGVLVLIIFVTFLFSGFSWIVVAQEDVASDDAYNCLIDNYITDNVDGLDSEQLSFSLLALAYDPDMQAELHTVLLALEKESDNCWPKNTCKIKDTALGIIALNHVGEDIDERKNWLLNQKKPAEGIDWYLEIDAAGAAECTVTYDENEDDIEDDFTINIADDRKINRLAGSCLQLAQRGYWFQITNDCFEKEFKITCNKDFISTILYKKQNSLVWHITNQIEAAGKGEGTKHELNFFCFGISNCDYEASLWGTLALKLTNSEEVSNFLPYLIVFSEDFPQQFPEAFLSKITGAEFFVNKIKEKKPVNRDYWTSNLISASTQTISYSNTALALLGLEGADPSETVKEDLLESLNPSNCWGGLSSTAFLLWVGWHRSPAPPPPDCEGEDEGDLGGFCLSSGECDNTKGYILDPNAICPAEKICCSEEPISERTCEEVGWRSCETNERCEGNLVTDKDGNECCAEIRTEEDNVEVVKGCVQVNCNDIAGAATCPANYGCAGETIETLDNPQCCLGGESRCTILKKCSEFGEPTCDLNEVCSSGVILPASDAQNCCVIDSEGNGCVLRECNAFSGNICARNEFCDGISYLASDVEEGETCCAVGSCELKTCADAGGRPCPLGQRCKGNTFDSSDVENCCPNNFECGAYELDCENEGLLCLPQSTCESIEGEFFNSNCQSGVCCSKSLADSCTDLDGEICAPNKACSINTVEVGTSEECCFGSCNVLKSCVEAGGKLLIESLEDYVQGRTCQPGQICEDPESNLFDTTDGSCCTGNCVWPDECSFIGQDC